MGLAFRRGEEFNARPEGQVAGRRSPAHQTEPIPARIVHRDAPCSATMNAILLIASVVVPLLPVVMFPTRFIGRGVGATVLGAGLLVGMMMVIYLSLSAITGGTSEGKAAAADVPDISNADLDALKDLF
jgi:hypothetical protein